MNIFSSPFHLFSLKEVFSKKSKYNKEVHVLDDGKVKRMVIGGYTQSRTLNSEGKSDGYWDLFLEIADRYIKEPEKILMLGLGGGTAAALFLDKYPKVKVDSIEIDPVVVEAAKIMFSLDKKRFTVKVADAAKAFEDKSVQAKYDLILMDVYAQGNEVPEQLYGYSYIKQMRKHLVENGLLLINQAFSQDYRLEFKIFIENLRSVFGNVYFQEATTSNNVIIYASAKKLS